MQNKRKEIESILRDNESISENTHPDRRKSKNKQNNYY